MKKYYIIFVSIVLVTMLSCQAHRNARFNDTFIKGKIEINLKEIDKNLNDKAIFHGYVYSLVDSVPLKGANVWISETKIGAATDENGYFRIETNPDNCIVRFSFVGHNEESSKEIRIERNEIILLTARLGTTIQ